MALDKQFVTSYSELYFLAGTIGDSTFATPAGDDFTAAEAKTYITAMTKIPGVMEIGTLSNEATVIDTPTFGEEFKGKLRGQLDGGQLDSSVFWAPDSTVHKALRVAAQKGTNIVVGILWLPTDGAAHSDGHFVAFNSFAASFGIDTTFDDVGKASITFPVNGQEYFGTPADA